MQTPQFTFPFPPPYPKQARIIESDARYLLCEAATKTGKTTAATVWLLREAPKVPVGGNLWWVAPSVTQADIPYSRLQTWIREWHLPDDIASIELSKSRITWMGRYIWFKTADNPDTIYGDDVWRMVVDEASRISDKAWGAIRSVLTHTKAPTRILMNMTNRHNWAYKLCRLAEAGEPGYEYIHIDWRDAVAGGVYTEKEVMDAKRAFEAAGTPEEFTKLFECLPPPDGGNPFGQDAIARCTIPARSTKPVAAFGVDVAKSVDYTWIIGLDEDGNECFSERWQTDWNDTFSRIRSIVGDTPCMIDSTGVGDPIAEELCRYCNGMEGYKISKRTKQLLMEHIRAEIHNARIGFFDPRLIRELQQFEYEETASGTRYGAPKGLHDDGVMALALAAYCLHNPEMVRVDFWASKGVIGVDV